MKNPNYIMAYVPFSTSERQRRFTFSKQGSHVEIQNHKKEMKQSGYKIRVIKFGEVYTLYYNR